MYRRAGGRRRQAEIGGHRLETELRWDFEPPEKRAATSCDLNRSIGDILQVDRGYLMVRYVGGQRHVKALKFAGFTNTLLNAVATDVCPEWSTWVQCATTVSAVRAAEGSIEKVGRAYVTIRAEIGKFAAGLYKGSLVAGTGGKRAPALSYVSLTQLAGD